MSPPATMRYAWTDLPWHTRERQVFKLQKRLFHASQRGEGQALHRLQRLAMMSRATSLLAVRQVTQDQPRKKDRRGRRSEITHPRRTSQAGRHTPKSAM